MMTLFLKTSSGIEHWLLNAKIQDSVNEKVINDVLDNNEHSDFWIEDGWPTIKV